MSVVAKRIWAEREPDGYHVFTDTPEEAEALKAYLRKELPDLETTGVVQLGKRFDRALFTAPVGPVPAWMLHDVLVKYPGAHSEGIFNVRIAERPHFTIRPDALAAWIMDQGEGVWWSVDGDPGLMSELDFPCPPDEICAALRKRSTPLLLADPESAAHGEELTREDGQRVTHLFVEFDHVLFLAWIEGAVDWLLVPERPMSGD